MMATAKRKYVIADGALRVWWIPQVPMKRFEVGVETLLEARLVLNTLAKYDLFQFENNIKPDYCNVGGLIAFDSRDSQWRDWHDTEGREFDQIPDVELHSAIWEGRE